MKIKLRPLLKQYIDWLQKKYNNLSNQNTEKKLPYHSLSPTDNAKNGESYFEALSWALKNKKKEDIKNIAIAGPNGSGKSSILKTFRKINSNKRLKFLNISLATFKEEDDNTANDKTKNGKNKNYNERGNGGVLRLIEQSILQQIFYHEKDSKIPDSRFRKIKSFGKLNLLWITVGLFIFLASFSNFFFHKFLLEDFLQLQINKPIESLINYISLFIFLMGTFIIIFKLIPSFHGIRVSKLNVIEFSDNVSKSILNDYLDEILYFFEVTNYNVVIFEDLDRFEQTEIFTKLREINLLINNSKKVKDSVVFIYAVRDDMFIDKDRTKFFDFVIPIIPVINSSNSNEILLQKREDNDYKISDDLIENISLFIDDMRLLHNVINEFHIYYQKLDEKLDQDKLLSMIVYKNIYPNDFTKLSSDKGVLYETINSKKKYIHTETSRIENLISEIKEEIIKLETHQIKDLDELKSLYILKYIEKVPGLISFKINQIGYSASQVLTDELFAYFINNNVNYSSYQPRFGQPRDSKIQYNFADIEKEVDPNKTFEVRKNIIEEWNINKADNKKKKIEELEKEKNKIKAFKIQELIQKGNVKITVDDSMQNRLISILLRNGYIGEDFLDYITIFYPGSITKSDHQFLLNIKSQIPSDFDYNIIKIDKLIPKINIFDFAKEYILNYKLLAFILQNNQHKGHQDKTFNLLSNETETSIRFIDGFIENGIETSSFIKELCKSWVNIWNYIDIQSSFTEDKKKYYFTLIIEHAEISDIESISENSNFIDYILNKKDFLTIISNERKLKILIETLTIKFINIDIKGVSKEIVEFIHKGDYYKINNEMIKLFMETIGNFSQVNFDTKNYFAIKNSNCIELLDYINININRYITNVYIEIDTNIKEDEDSLIELLNFEKLSNDNKTKLISKIQTKIADLSRINALEIEEILLNESKVEPIWSNIITHYENNENELSSPTIVFINQKSNAIELSKNKIPIDVDTDESIFSDFIIKLIKKEEINSQSYDLILKSIPYVFKSLDFDILSQNKVELLVQNNILELNPDNYNLLKESFENLHITFIEINKKDFFKYNNEIEFDEDDLLSLLKSDELLSTDKSNILLRADEDIITVNAELIMLIGELIIDNTSFNISDNILYEVIISAKLTDEQKISILILKSSFLAKEHIKEMLASLDRPYSAIAINGKRPLIKNTTLNIKFVEILNSKDIISKFDIVRKGIRISTYKK